VKKSLDHLVRVAGNIIDGAGVTVKGSTEYAAAELNIPLILVLGHSGCSAQRLPLSTSITGTPDRAPY